MTSNLTLRVSLLSDTYPIGVTINILRLFTKFFQNYFGHYWVYPDIVAVAGHKVG